MERPDWKMQSLSRRRMFSVLLCARTTGGANRPEYHNHWPSNQFQLCHKYKVCALRLSKLVSITRISESPVPPSFQSSAVPPSQIEVKIGEMQFEYTRGMAISPIIMRQAP